MFNPFKKKPPVRFPPVPDWRPSIRQPLDRLIERFNYYNDGRRDFAVFAHGTCAVVPDGLSESEAIKAACEILSEIFNYHPDMRPNSMDDGNILVTYNQPAGNVVLSEVLEANLPEIRNNHQRALATSEVLITPLGPNRFDDLGIAALFGRCFMFMDAQDPRVVRIVRKSAE